MTINFSSPIKSTCIFLSIAFLLLLGYQNSNAQSLLGKQVSVNLAGAPLADVLKELGKQGGFYFAYNAALLKPDSLVSVTANNQTVGHVLTTLFHDRYNFEESKNYVIITTALSKLALLNADITNDNNTYSISGLVVNERTGERLMNASVYLKQQLISALTDEHGYFKIKFRADNPGQISLTASKLAYKDTSINFLQTVSISSRFRQDAYDHITNKNNRVEKTGMGRLLISARQRIQSLNIPDFFATRPFQISLTPGLSSHGMFSPQVVNKFSINLIGGYTAGVNGIEFGGLFNINKMNSRYLQLAGVFNLVGGTVTGLQIAGVNNRALDTVKGAQLALFINNAEGNVNGVQISALNNSAHILKGLQIGFVNNVDTSEGASIGLINIIGNGFYKVGAFTSDLMNTNIYLQTGTHAFYSTLLIGTNISTNNKLHAFGLGLGHDFMFSNKVYLSAQTDYMFAYSGLWDDRLFQAKLLLNLQLSKNISMIAGPTYNSYNHSNSFAIEGYKDVTHVGPYSDVFHEGHQVRNWIGWQAGLAFNSVFKSSPKIIDNSNSWYLGAATTMGVGWDQPYGNEVYGTELFTHRELGEHLTGTLSVGYTQFIAQKNQLPDVYYDFTHDRKFIPVKVGIRLNTGKHFYIGGEIGEAFGLFQQQYNFLSDNKTFTSGIRSYRGGMYAVSAGFTFRSGLEAGAKFEDYGLQTQYKQFALRLGYRLRLSK